VRFPVAFVLTLVAAAAFGLFVPQLITDDFGGRLLISVIGGAAIGVIGGFLTKTD